MNLIKMYKDIEYANQDNYELAKIMIKGFAEDNGIKEARNFFYTHFSENKIDEKLFNYRASLSDSITLYRGLNSDSDIDGISWSSCLETALKFASMGSQGNTENHRVVSREVRFDDVLYMFLRESEFLVIPDSELETVHCRVILSFHDPIDSEYDMRILDTVFPQKETLYPAMIA